MPKREEKKENKIEQYLQEIILKNNKYKNLLENLPVKWQGFDFVRFSKDKRLFDFQQNSLKNALKVLWLFFKDKNADKKAFFELYKEYVKKDGLEKKLDYNLKKQEGKNKPNYLSEYENDYPVVDSKISFAYFINRMSFWMATGSGKTLIIVKLIELLGKLISEKELPAGDILFLAHREDLLDQFKNHINEFNSFNSDTKINLKNLRDYESVKHENALPFARNEITVFYYRSDLISDEQKEKIVNFKNYDNDGRWYILLDEAHKGDKEDSKRQILYSILSRNGFLFNFSATFTDPRDFVTCVFNFNLSNFVKEEYGKHIYVSSTEINAFRKQNDFSSIEKQKIVLKALLLFTYVKKYFEKIRKIDNSLYHHPLLLTLVNSVSAEDSDLKMFFRELEKVAKNEIRADLLEKAKKELKDEFSKNQKFEFEELECAINTNLISSLSYEDILKYVLNANAPGKIEVLKIPGNPYELIFRLMTAEKPFALIKIGNISSWLKDQLKYYEINESFENESYFRQINLDDSDINILMGSRAFYEGWDTNRPNLLLFVNIGVGSDTKKFVLQSIGRGVRIEPQKYQRKRLQSLSNNRMVEEELFNKVKDLILPIESLFIFGTDAEILLEIIRTLKSEKSDKKNLGEDFILNPEAQKHTLLIPVYKNSEKNIAEDMDPVKYHVSEEDFETTLQFYRFLGDKIALAKYDCEVNLLKEAKESFAEKERYFYSKEISSLFEPELILGRIFDYLGVKNREFEKFKKLENEIVHFKQIALSDDKKYDEILNAIRMVRNYSLKADEEKEIDKVFDRTKNIEIYKQSIRNLDLDFQPQIRYDKLKIKYLANHYYLPVIVSESEKIDYLIHIIDVKSEVNFIEQLEEYLKKSNNIFEKFDWWMFSKIDQTLDEVAIPYYNDKNNRIDNYHPDFIFWMQKGEDYLILFIDPHGTVYSDTYNKIDYYSKLFETKETKECKVFTFDGLKVRTKLLYKPAKGGREKVPERYKQYWFDNFVDFSSKIRRLLNWS